MLKSREHDYTFSASSYTPLFCANIKMCSSPNSSDDYDYKFVAEPDDGLTCRVCLKVAQDPRQHVDGECGMLFCRKCIEKWGMDKPCPNCRMEHPKYSEDARSRRDIRELSVKCDNVERGCQWVGTVGTLEEHVGVCDFTLVPCFNKCKDDNGILMIIMRRDLQQHLIKTCPNRDYSCEHCGLKGTYATTQDHYHTCEKMIVTCTNEECDMRMERMKIKNHLANDCEHTVISCKYVSIGCDVKLKRKNMRDHEQDDKAHLNKALNTVVELKDTVVKLEHHSQSLRKGKPVIFELVHYQKKKDNDEIFFSPSFYTSHNGYHMKIRMYANDGGGSYISVYMYIIEGKYDTKLKWPFKGTVTIEVLNQLEDKDHYKHKVNITQYMNQTVGRNCGYFKCIPHSVLSYDSNSNTQYLKDDTLYFRISVQVPDHKPWLQTTV